MSHTHQVVSASLAPATNIKKSPDFAVRGLNGRTNNRGEAKEFSVGQRPIGITRCLKIVYTPRIAGTRDLCANARTFN